MNRKVTEVDFRRPEFRDANPDDYEMMPNGEIARKDRWERAISSIRFLVGITDRTYEISEVLDAVKNLVSRSEGWVSIDDDDDLPPDGANVNIRVEDGSVLNSVTFNEKEKTWQWPGGTFTGEVTGWQKRPIRPSVLEFHTK